MTDSSSLVDRSQQLTEHFILFFALEQVELTMFYHFQSCELLLLSKLGWDVYLDCQQEEHVTMLDNLSVSN